MALEVKELYSGDDHECKAFMDNGELTVLWRKKGKGEQTRQISLTREETGNLLDLLYNNRDEILKH